MENVKTTIYFVRHADSIFMPNLERERGLTEKGKKDIQRIIEILRNEIIDIFTSSPYERAIQTIRELANTFKKEIYLVEDLREREIGMIPDNKFKAAKERVYNDFGYTFPSGESSNQAQQRAIKALRLILNEHYGKSIVIGTHGDIMTLMMNYFNKNYGFEFWSSSTMPDIYRTEFQDGKLIRVERLWN